MPAMSIELSQFHLSEQGLHAHAALKRDFMQDHMTACLTFENVADPTQSTQ